MRTSLIEFDRSIRDLRDQLRRFGIEEALLAADPLPDSSEAAYLLQSLRGSVEPFAFKQSNYSTAIILLYGAFERFVDALVVAAAREFALATPAFALLSPELRESHRRRTIEAMADSAWLAKGDESIQSLSEGLYLCESGSESYRLNVSVFSRHRQNYRKELLASTLGDIGCTELLARLRDSRRVQHAAASLSNIGSSEELLGLIDDLVSRRNDVAHGGISDLLSVDQLDEWSRGLWCVAVAMFELVVEDLGLVYSDHVASPLDTVDKVHYKHVCLFDLGVLELGTLIRVGDPVVMVGSNVPERSRVGRVISIQVNGDDLGEVRAASGVLVGLGFSFRPIRGARIAVGSSAGVLGWLADDLPIAGTL